jgi:hypothetical protein
VPVEVTVRRVVSWPSVDCGGEPEVFGEPWPADDPPSQDEPKKGAGPRVDCGKAAGKAREHPFALLAFRDSDDYPAIVPVEIAADSEAGFELTAARDLLPPGARRAGLISHDYEEQLRGIATRQFTGWLTSDGDGRATYAPHTEQGFKAPTNKSLLLLANGFMAKKGLKKARRDGSLERLKS